MVAAYFATQMRMMNSDDLAFPVVNLLGSVLIVYSLLAELQSGLDADRRVLDLDQRDRHHSAFPFAPGAINQAGIRR